MVLVAVGAVVDLQVLQAVGGVHEPQRLVLHQLPRHRHQDRVIGLRQKNGRTTSGVIGESEIMCGSIYWVPWGDSPRPSRGRRTAAGSAAPTRACPQAAPGFAPPECTNKKIQSTQGKGGVFMTEKKFSPRRFLLDRCLPPSSVLQTKVKMETIQN